MSTRNHQDFCVICSDPFKLDKVNNEKLVVHEINCAFAESSAPKSYSIKNVLSTIYNIGSLWPDDDDQDKVGACPTCAQVLTNLFIFYETVNQLLNQESILFQMIRVLEQITGPKINQFDTGRPGTIIKMNQSTEQPSTINKLQDITGQQQHQNRGNVQQQQITPQRVILIRDLTNHNIGAKPQTTKKWRKIASHSGIVNKFNSVKEPSGSQNESINKSPSLHIRMDHDYSTPIQCASSPSEGHQSQPLPAKEKNRKFNENEPWSSTGNDNQQPLATVSSAEEKVDDRRQDEDDVDTWTPCHEPDDNGQDEIVIEKIIVHPPSTVSAMSTSRKSNESAAPLNEDIEIKTEFLTCGTCQKIFIYEKNLVAHRKICKLRRKIFLLPSQKFSVKPRLLEKSSAQNQQQQEQGSTTCGTKGNPPSALHLPTIRKRLCTLATPGKSIVCPICKTNVDNVEDCIVHLKKSHFPFNCTKCHIIYSTSVSWEQHMAKEHGYNSSNNNSSSNNNNNSSNKSNNNSSNRVKKFCHRKRYPTTCTPPIPLNRPLVPRGDNKCSTCGKNMGSRQTLATHVKLHWPYRCDGCRKRFETAAKLSSHTLQCQGIKLPYVCTHGDPTTCGRAFHKNFMLADHIRRHHTKDRPFMCEICGKAFKTKSTLKGHLRSHMEAVRRFACTVEGCDKSYVLRSSLAIHMNTHLGIKGFLCTVCGNGYTQKHLLDFHMKMTHNTGDLPFACPSCPKRFPSKCYLTAHLKSSHLSRRHAKRSFKCTICDKGFTNNAALAKHSKIHNGCSICGLVILHNRARWAHMRKHNSEKNNELSKKQTKRRRTKVVEESESLDEDDEIESVGSYDDDHDDEQQKDSSSSSVEEDSSD